MVLMLILCLYLPVTVFANDVEEEINADSVNNITENVSLIEDLTELSNISNESMTMVNCEQDKDNQNVTANGVVDDTVTIENELKNIRSNTYPDGCNWDPLNRGFEGGLQCFGFAKKIQNLLFKNIPQVDKYSIAGANLKLVAETSDKSANSIRNLLSHAQAGDWIQGSTPNQHSMIFCWQGGDQFAIYDANGVGGYNIVSMRNLNYNAFASKSWSKVCLFRNTAYPQKAVTPTDTEKPMIHNVRLDNQSGNGRMMYIDVTDNANVSRVWCPTFAPGEGEGEYFPKEASRQEGSSNVWMCAIFADDHGGKEGEYQTRVYAFDDAGNVSECYVIGYYIDCHKPEIQSVSVTDVSSTGYTVNCTFSDNIGIDRVMFPTWQQTNKDGSLIWKQGEINGNTATCSIRISDYNYQKDNYITHLYVYDKAQNWTGNSLESYIPFDLKTGKNIVIGEATYQNSQYLLVDDAVTWDEAKSKAEEKGGHLAVITTQEEQNVINGLLGKGNQRQYFIGGLKSSENFTWCTGEALSLTNWDLGEPNNYANKENYISIYENGKWNDIFNTAYQGYIVEIESEEPVVESPLSVGYLNTDKMSNQVLGTSIGLSAAATGGTAPYQFKFYAKVGSITKLIQDYSSAKTAVFIPSQAGTYNIFVEVKDNSGNTATKTIDNFVIYEEQTEEPDDDSGDTDTTTVTCSYQTHVQNVGWQDLKTNGETSGTSGKGLRLEGIRINLDTNASELGLSYATHVQNIGWQDPVATGVMSGTSGKSLRLEAIRINLTGTKAHQYDIYYRVHAQNVGWLDWAKNGEDSGTAGFGYRLEGIEIKVQPKGNAAPGSITRPFVSQ